VEYVSGGQARKRSFEIRRLPRSPESVSRSAQHPITIQSPSQGRTSKARSRAGGLVRRPAFEGPELAGRDVVRTAGPRARGARATGLLGIIRQPPRAITSEAIDLAGSFRSPPDQTKISRVDTSAIQNAGKATREDDKAKLGGRRHPQRTTQARTSTDYESDVCALQSYDNVFTVKIRRRNRRAPRTQGLLFEHGAKVLCRATSAEPRGLGQRGVALVRSAAHSRKGQRQRLPAKRVLLVTLYSASKTQPEASGLHPSPFGEDPDARRAGGRE